MSFQIFLIPSLLDEDKGAVWQLQLLAEAYDVLLKPARRSGHRVLSAADASEIARSDAVVCIATKLLGNQAQAEIDEAKRRRKPIYYLVEKSIAEQFPGHPASWIVFTRDQGIDELSRKIRDVVKRETSKGARTTLGWLLGIGAALIILGAIAGEKE